MVNPKNLTDFEKLTRANINGGVWMDAGCGTGTFTFHLEQLVDKVFAVDKDKRKLARLRQKIDDTHHRIEVLQKDFNVDQLCLDELDGVLFPFSLHYQQNKKKALQNVLGCIKPNGRIVIIDYVRTTPVPWIPKPFPPDECESVLKQLFSSVTRHHISDRYYIISATHKIR